LTAPYSHPWASRDPPALLRQLELRSVKERQDLYFHQRLLNGELPQSIGGGIGQSRLCMFFLHKAHIGEIQSSLWEMVDSARRKISPALTSGNKNIRRQ
jgi:aspartate--ammonia ligase